MNNEWTWAQMLTWCITATCTAAVLIILIVFCSQASVQNCERRAEMVENVAASNDGGVFIVPNGSMP